MAQTYQYVRDLMRLIEAEAWVIAKLGATARAEHSRFVGYLMRRLGERLEPDEAEIWEMAGLLHDLDFFVVDGDWHIHGRTTVAWLEGRLPIPALVAIAAHDHRSGIVSDAPMSMALRLADAVAVLDDRAGRNAVIGALRQGDPAIAELAGDRAFLRDMIVGLSGRLGLELGEVAMMLDGLPQQG
jgi:hypothetical protein